MKHLINYYGTMSWGQGYSGSIEQTVLALEKRDDIDVRVIAFNKSSRHKLSSDTIAIKDKPFKLSDVGIVHGFPNAFDSNMSTGFRVGYTMFETDTLPTGKHWAGRYEDPAKMINQFCDLLFVPCSHNVELFRSSGVTIPIEVIPNGVNPEIFPYIERKRDKDHVYTFFMYGTLTLRKNPGMVISAFANLFKDNPNVRLVLKTQSGTLGHIEYVDMGRIEVIDELWDEKRLLQGLADADCMVFPTRGEGFGLPPMEAMSTGLPTIIADNTGMRDYSHKDYNLTCKTKAIVPALRYPRKWGNVGNWYEPDYEDVKKYMKWCYENQEEAKQMGQRASAWVHANWTYDDVAEKIVKAIKKHYKGWK